jgi:uracil-DNA glycosylase
MPCFNNQTCNACGLCATRTLVVNGKGNPSAKIWIIGRDPGEEEDACGIPFVGRAGKRLSELLGELEKETFIVNLVRCHTPNNAGPTQKQMDACYKFLLTEMDANMPEILILLGNAVASYFFGKDIAVSKYRGEYYHDVDLGIPVIVTYHPSFLIRNAHSFDQEFVDDLHMAKEYVED